MNNQITNDPSLPLVGDDDKMNMSLSMVTLENNDSQEYQQGKQDATPKLGEQVKRVMELRSRLDGSYKKTSKPLKPCMDDYFDTVNFHWEKVYGRPPGKETPSDVMRKIKWKDGYDYSKTESDASLDNDENEWFDTNASLSDDFTTDDEKNMQRLRQIIDIVEGATVLPFRVKPPSFSKPYEPRNIQWSDELGLDMEENGQSLAMGQRTRQGLLSYLKKLECQPDCTFESFLKLLAPVKKHMMLSRYTIAQLFIILGDNVDASVSVESPATQPTGIAANAILRVPKYSKPGYGVHLKRLRNDKRWELWYHVVEQKILGSPSVEQASYSYNWTLERASFSLSKNQTELETIQCSKEAIFDILRSDAEWPVPFMNVVFEVYEEKLARNWSTIRYVSPMLAPNAPNRTSARLKGILVYHRHLLRKRAKHCKDSFDEFVKGVEGTHSDWFTAAATSKSRRGRRKAEKVAPK